MERELFVRPKGSELFPDYNLLTVAPHPSVGGTPLDVPVIVEGRAPDPASVDEVAMSEALAADLGLHVGDRVDLESMSFEWVETSFNGGDAGPPDGPEVTAELVGLARTPADFGRHEGVLHLTEAYADQHQEQVRTYTFVVASVTDGLRARLDAGQDLAADGNDSLEVMTSPQGRSEAVQDSLDTIATALRLVAAITAVAGLAVIWLLATRVARDAADDLETLVAIGWTRPEVVRLVTSVLAPALVVGVLIGLLVGVVVSPAALMGLAAAVDPAGRAIRRPPRAGGRRGAGGQRSDGGAARGHRGPGRTLHGRGQGDRAAGAPAPAPAGRGARGAAGAVRHPRGGRPSEPLRRPGGGRRRRPGGGRPHHRLVDRAAPGRAVPQRAGAREPAGHRRG